MQTRCFRCRSTVRAIPGPVTVVGGRGSYTCRDPWHSPSQSDDVLAAIEFAKAADEQFQQDIPLDPETLGFNPYRHTTSAYP